MTKFLEKNITIILLGIIGYFLFSISSSSNYSAEPCVLKRGGAGFVVERIGKLNFPQ